MVILFKGVHHCVAQWAAKGGGRPDKRCRDPPKVSTTISIGKRISEMLLCRTLRTKHGSAQRALVRLDEGASREQPMVAAKIDGAATMDLQGAEAGEFT